MSGIASAAGTLAGKADGLQGRVDATTAKIKGGVIKGVLGWHALQALVTGAILMLLAGIGLALASVMPLSAALGLLGGLLLAVMMLVAWLAAR